MSILTPYDGPLTLSFWNIRIIEVIALNLITPRPSKDMSIETKIEANLWERFTDQLGAVSEGVVNFLGRLFGSSNERVIRRLGYIRPRNSEEHVILPGSVLDQVNAHEESMKALTDEELKALTPQFRDRLATGETLDDLLPEVFAACREAAFRTKNMRHFDTQILGGAVLHEGNIAEMVTGEGKTLVATLPACLNALDGKGVHIITVNDYLARRDCEWMSPIYHALGLSRRLHPKRHGPGGASQGL